MKIDTIEKNMHKNKSIEDKINKFIHLLESLSDLDDKRKLLWIEIYNNAVNDRELANVMFADAFLELKNTNNNHALLGATITKYLERMSKSNEQILRLAEMIVKVDEQEKSMNIDALYDNMVQ
jgi:hypothetical protein